jgi:hypothetical protein
VFELISDVFCYLADGQLGQNSYLFYFAVGISQLFDSGFHFVCQTVFIICRGVSEKQLKLSILHV